MCSEFSKLLKNLYPDKIYFLDTDADCIERFSGIFLGPSNRMNGWLVPKDKADSFYIDFIAHKEEESMESYRKSFWSYYDGEYSGKWLFNSHGSLFGETVL